MKRFLFILQIICLSLNLMAQPSKEKIIEKDGTIWYLTHSYNRVGCEITGKQIIPSNFSKIEYEGTYGGVSYFTAQKWWKDE